MKKRIISLVMVIVLVLSMMPMMPLTANAVSSDEAEVYAPVVEKILNSAIECVGEEFVNYYAEGILYDMDNDGTEELVLSYPQATETKWLWYYAYSVYDIENGKLVTVAEDVTFGASAAAAGSDGYTGVALYHNVPVLITCSEVGETSVGQGCKYPKQRCTVNVYSYDDFDLIKTVEVRTTYDEIIYSVDSNSISEQEFQKEMEAFTYLEFVLHNDVWISLRNPIESMQLDEMLKHLKNVSSEEPSDGVKPVKRLVKIIQTMPGYEDTTEYTFTYNEWNLPASIHQASSSGYEHTAEYIYDEAGRFIRYGSSDENVYTYDSNGLLTKYVDRVGDRVSTYTYFYNSEGNLDHSVCDRWGGSETTKYFYDKNGCLERAQNESGNEYYTYDNEGRLQKVQNEYATTTYSYNADGCLERAYTEHNHPTLVITSSLYYDFENNAPFIAAHGEGTSSELWIEDTEGHTVWSLENTRSTAYTGDLAFETDSNGLIIAAEDELWKWEFIYEEIEVEQSGQTQGDTEEQNDIYKLVVYTVDRNLSIRTGKKLQLICVLYCNDELVEEWNGVSWGIIRDPAVGDIITVSDHREIDVGYSLYVEGLQEGKTNLTITEGMSGAHITLEISVCDDWAMPVGCSITNVPSEVLEKIGDFGTQVNFYDYSGLYVTDFPENPVLQNSQYHLEFNVYNSSYMHGSVDVYNSNGEWIRSQKIDKNENVRDVVGTMYDGLVAIGEWVTGKSFSFKASTFSTHTKISIDVPEGGYMVISNNISQSPGVFLYNGIDYYLQLLGIANDMEFGSDEVEKIEKVTLELVKEKFMDNFTESYSKILRGMAIDSSGNILEMAFVDKISELVEVTQTAVGSLVKEAIFSTCDVAVDVFKDLVPKEVTVWLDTLFGISKATDALGQAIDICTGIDDSYIVLYTPEASTHMTVDGVSATPSKNAFPQNAIFQSSLVPNEEVSIKQKNLYIDEYRVYDIGYSVDGMEIQPNGSVIIRIPMPNGYDEKECIVLHQQENGTWEVENAEFENGYAIVEVSHFSLFAIARGYLIEVEPEQNNLWLWIVAGIAVACIIILSALSKNRKKKILLITFAVFAILLIILAIILHPEKDDQSVAQAPENVTEWTQKDTNPTGVTEEVAEEVTDPPTESARDIPDGTVLIDDSWESGDIVIVAVDDTTLWVQITDDRSNHMYNDYGTPWNVSLFFGTEMKIQNSVGGYAVNYPFRISLESLAAKAMKTHEYEQGYTSESFSVDYLNNLHIWEVEEANNGFRSANESWIENLDIKKKDNTYTALISLPEWFDVSVYDEFTFAEVTLYGTDYYSNLYRNGSAMHDGWYRFNPSTT